MRNVGSFGVLCFCAAIGLAACSSDNPQLMNLQNPGNGPEEFGVLPTKPLETPPSYTSLPTPTPGGTNRVDPTPRADAIAALGGNAARARPATGDLVNYTTRFGTTSNIRGQLAAEDLEWRKKNQGRVLYRAFGVPQYFEAYEKMSLDQYQELQRWRRRGIDTPAAPPKPN
ncbi:DUF3035 domain-containing protein [Halocynthiibacter sp. C4]|uniref:DUF3035 domain-containing protein n=1 Tax=Halocynthiibacter sp. C4 TaxID=2992758 RepID=UPI00237A9CD2|nr:DUF3035 domain-containing protein [Halocynthiibacter sp. C4]MDE0591115.1 DUF3035 domain-containing protein [Halocynthiibacter sp. C4]